MDDILTYLEDLTYPDSLPPEYFALLKAQDPYLDTIQKQLSLRFLDDFTDAQCESIRWLRQEAFSRGFRLGAQLILALAGPSSPSIHHRS